MASIIKTLGLRSTRTTALAAILVTVLSLARHASAWLTVPPNSRVVTGNRRLSPTTTMDHVSVLHMNLLSGIGDMLSGGKLTPQTELPYGEPLGPINRDDVQTLAIQERAISFTGEDFSVADASTGRPFCRVTGAMLHLPGKDKMTLSLNSGGKAATLDRKLVAMTPTYDILRSNGQKLGLIEKKIVALTDTFEVHLEGGEGFGPFKAPSAYKIEGDFIDRRFVVKNSNNKLPVSETNHEGPRLQPLFMGKETKNFASSMYLASILSISSAMMILPNPVAAAAPTPVVETQGLEVVTQSALGQSVRRGIVGGAQLADKLDLQWERFSDSLRDEAKCDPVTNRRMFDNGFRRDGTRIGNPVLGALCTPEPLKELDTAVAQSVLSLAQEAAMNSFSTKDQASELQRNEARIKELVAPAFTRATTLTATADSKDEQPLKRQEFNRDLYTKMRAYGDMMTSSTSSSTPKALTATSRTFERRWGDNILAAFAPNANRKDFASPFPKPDPTDEQPYDEGSLLDALGGVSVVLQKMQQGGLIGHWEISIPEDDDWNVVTIAVDDDITIGGQI